MLLHTLTKTARAYPDKAALILGNTRLSYKELCMQIESFMHRLRSLNVSEAACVALVLPNSVAFVVSFYALAGLKAIALPLNPHVKADEFRYYLTDNDIRVIITTSEQASMCRLALSKLGKNIPLVIVDQSFGNRADFDRDISHVSFDGPAIYQYSSGSTGQTKKVCRTQKNLLYETEAYINGVHMTAEDRVLCLIPLFHAHGFGKCMLASMATGATLVLLEQPVRDEVTVEVPFAFRVRRVLELVEQERISLLPATPYIFGMLAEVAEEVPVDVSTLRMCLSGGNFLPEETFLRFKQRFGLPLRSVYGSTETGSIALNTEPDEEVCYASVGRPSGDIEVRITNGEALEELPVGSSGEIAVKSQAMTTGYLNMPELNRAAFRDGFFFTGDLGKKDEQGRLYITGRKKIFIESGGEKIDPLEIEQVLITHPAVSEAVVVGIAGPYGGEAIKAVIVPAGEPTELEILLYCKERLSDYKVPRIVEFRQTLPKSQLGKILRKDLVQSPDSVTHTRSSSKGDSTIRARILAGTSGDRSSELEQFLTLRICQQIAALLLVDVAKVDAQRPLGEFGLGSLMAVELRDWLEASLELTLPVTIFWSYPTAAALASHLVSMLRRSAHPEEHITAEALDLRKTGVDKKERAEPIAIIGMSCRFPGGASSPEAFWQLLVEGRDAITEVPPDRYNIDDFYDPDADAPGKTVSRWGGFLDAIDQFDPMFFGISPREAMYLDPQQRLLLEVSWEAMERAGLLPEKLFGSKTGVFIGLFNHDYLDMQLEQMVYENAASANPYTGIGNGPSFAAGRISYLLGLQGPSMVIDTVCSSSLVAVHLACQSLRNGECTTALAGAANLTLYPLSTIITSKMRALSPQGRSKTFDASADGFVRGEGCAVVILKRLSQALADGDPILALIRGSAVNQDGRSSGLTAPNGLAQQAVIREALRNAGLTPEKISYVETHGTGTALGDPIEFDALKAAIGQERPDGSQCMLGSVKTNIGHLEACAGMAGLIKTVLCMHHGLIPPVLHLKNLNPHISLEHTPFVIPTSLQPWPAGVERKYAGVGGAGLSGTNAHVVLEEAPKPGSKCADTSQTAMHHLPYLLPLSARDPQALRQLARTYQRELMLPASALAGASLQDICRTASTRRTHYPYRIAVTGQSHDEFAARLEEFAEGSQAPVTAAEGATGETMHDPVFMFAGQGTQWVGMGQQLYEQEPIFRAAIEACDALLKQHVQWSLLEVLQTDEHGARLHETEVAQVALFAIQVALAALWRSWGIVPGAVVGHSVGEIAAAYVASVLSLDDAVRVVAHRGRLMQQAHGLGKMAAVEFSETEAKRWLVDYPDRLSIGAVNSPESVVLSGEAEALEEVLRSIEREGVFFRRLQVDYAFHSPQMERFRASLVRELQGLQPGSAALTLISTVTGQKSSSEEYHADYWGRNMCQEVRFGPAIETLIAMGYQTFLEISPQPALARPTRQCLEHHRKQGLVLPSLRQGVAERPVMLASLGTLYAQGHAVNWERLYPPAAGPYNVVTLPTYQWQRKRYWFTERKPRLHLSRGSFGRPVRHPLLGQRLRSATKEILFETLIDTHTISWLNDHQVYDTTVLPASAYVEMILASAREVLKEQVGLLNDLFIHQALLLPPDSNRVMQVIVNPSADGTHATVRIFSCPENEQSNEDEWILHAGGTVPIERDQQSRSTERAPQAPVLADIQLRCAQIMEGQQHYQHMRNVGLYYGTSFQGVDQIWRRDGEAVASIILPRHLEGETAQYYIHPALLDACFQVVEASLAKKPDESETSVYLPFSIDHMRFFAQPGKRLWCYVQVRAQSMETEATRVVDVQLMEENGQRIAEVHGLHLRRAPREALIPQARQEARDWFYKMIWERQAREIVSAGSASPSSTKDGSWLVFCDRSGTGTRLAERLQTEGERCVLVFAGQGKEIEEPACYCIDPTNATEFRRLLDEYFSGGRFCRGILHMWSLDAGETGQATVTSLETDQSTICGSVLHIIQAVAQERWSSFPRLWIITRGSQAVTERENNLSVAQSPVWGLGRVIALEQPDLHCKRIDLDHATSATEEAEELFQELQHAASEDQIAFRSHERYVARLARSVSQERGQPQRARTQFRSDSTYLITGGLGGLGLATARWMVKHAGVKHLVLTSRSGIADAVRPAIDELERATAQVLVICTDVAQEDQVAQMLATVRSTMPPLRGIIHAAGVLDDGILLQQNWQRFSNVMAPKVQGSWNLHTHTLDLPLDFFVMFSSGASLMGSAGQGNYAAANAFMDALAHYRRLQGLPATSINWGAWADAGMATTASIKRRLAKDGMQSIGLAQGLEVLEQLLQQNPIQTGVLPIDWTTFAKHFATDERPPFLMKLLDGAQLHAPATNISLQEQRDDLLRKLEAVPESEKVSILQLYIYQQVRQVLGLDASFKLEPRQNLFEIGMDSLMAVELRNRFPRLREQAVPANVVFDHPNVEALTAYLAARLLLPA